MFAKISMFAVMLVCVVGFSVGCDNDAANLPPNPNTKVEKDAKKDAKQAIENAEDKTKNAAEQAKDAASREAEKAKNAVDGMGN